MRRHSHPHSPAASPHTPVNGVNVYSSSSPGRPSRSITLPPRRQFTDILKNPTAKILQKNSFLSLCHVSLVMLGTYLILATSPQSNHYTLATGNNFCHYFAPEGCLGERGGCLDSTTYDDDRFCHISRVNKTFDSVFNVLSAYSDSVTNRSLAMYTHDNNTLVTMDVDSFELGGTSTTSEMYVLSPSDLGPIDIRHRNLVQLREFYSSLIQFRVHLQLNDTVPSTTSMTTNSVCMTWNVTINYVDQNEALLKVFLTYDRVGNCDASVTREEIYTEGFFLYCLVILLDLFLGLTLVSDMVASLRQMILCKQILCSGSIDMRLDDRLRAKVGPRGSRVSLSFWTSFIDLWDLGILTGCVSSIGGATAALLGTDVIPLEAKLAMNGLGCGMFWISLCKYLQNSRRFYAIVLIVKRATPQVLRILVDCAPFFVGYSLVGMSLFGGSSSRFSSLGNSMTTLFSLMNGDVVLETIDIVRVHYGAFGALYIVSFFFLFVYFFLNVFLTVVEESLWLVFTEKGNEDAKKIKQALNKDSSLAGISSIASRGGQVGRRNSFQFDIRRRSSGFSEGDEDYFEGLADARNINNDEIFFGLLNLSESKEIAETH